MRFLLTAVLLAGLTPNAFGWGAKGHRLIASLAEQRLRTISGNPMQKVAALLGPGLSLASIASCADSIRDYVSNKDKPDAVFPSGCIVTKEEAVSMFPSSGSWHYVNIPVPAASDPSSHPKAALQQACAERPPCILTQIERFTAQLKNKNLDTRTRAIALMFLVHLVGDLHQPLHAVNRNDDRGGNEVFVKIGTRVGRLHSLWDSFFMESIEEADVQSLANSGGGKPSQWAWESYDAAQRTVYNHVPLTATSFENPVILPDPAYRDAAARVIKMRLRAASIRLADLLAKALRG